MDDIWISSLMKYPIMANDINKDDSPIAEWDINLKCFVIKEVIIPNKSPIAIDTELSNRKFPNIYRINNASNFYSCPSLISLDFFLISFIA
jgi:hypothetical protein